MQMSLFDRKILTLIKQTNIQFIFRWIKESHFKFFQALINFMMYVASFQLTIGYPELCSAT